MVGHLYEARLQGYYTDVCQLHACCSLAALALRYARCARCAIAALLLPSIVGSGGLGLGRVTRTATWTNDCVFFYECECGGHGIRYKREYECGETLSGTRIEGLHE